MGLGILEDRVLEHVPGTTRHFGDQSRPQDGHDHAVSSNARDLKYDRSGPVPIVLHPQPSDDPNDPLNWPLWRRDLITLILSLTAIFATCLGPILAANTLTLSVWYGMDFTYIALLTGYFLLGVGVTAFVCVPSGRVWGKRHLFIIGTVVLIVTSAWAGAAGHNYTSLLWARIFQGLGTAPFESLVNAAVGDLYFVHERGKRMAFTNLAVFGGAFFTPIVVGKITHTIGWWWTFNLVAIFCSVCLVAVVLLCPETAFRRDAELNTDMGTLSGPSSPLNEPAWGAGDHEGRFGNEGSDEKNDENGGTLGNGAFGTRPQQPPPTTTTATAGTTGGIPEHGLRERRKKTFLESLSLFDGRKTDDNFLTLLFRPLPLFAQPAILWACLIQGCMIGWTVFIGVILAAIFLGPPLFWGEIQTGYAYVGPFVGALLGFFISGFVSDTSAAWLTRLNGGVYEPEFRLILVIPQMVLGCAGIYGFGITAQGTLEGRFHWAVPIVFFGLEVAGMVVGAVASSLYIVDAYRDLAVEAFTCTIIFKNVFSFALTFKAYRWLVYGGIEEVFNAIASVQVVVCLLTIPMYIFGKRNRSFFHRHDLLKMTGLKR